jgi:hypothetical protein
LSDFVPVTGKAGKVFFGAETGKHKEKLAFPVYRGDERPIPCPY